MIHSFSFLAKETSLLVSYFLFTMKEYIGLEGFHYVSERPEYFVNFLLKLMELYSVSSSIYVFLVE